MTKTLITELINKFQELITECEKSTSIFDKHIVLKGLQTTLEIMKQQLPAERAFAEKCFDAGKNSVSHVICQNHRGDEYIEETEIINFTTFYKNEYGTD